MVHYLSSGFVPCIPWVVHIRGIQIGFKSDDAIENLEIPSIRFMHVHPFLRLDGF
jgi:hypothetical protein